MCNYLEFRFLFCKPISLTEIRRLSTMLRYTQICELASQIFDEHGLVVHEIVLNRPARCGTKHKPDGQDGFYYIHADGRPNITLINYHDGEGGRKYTIPLYDKHEDCRMSPEERKAWLAHIQHLNADRARQLEERHRKAAERAEALFPTYKPATGENPYLKRKKVLPLGDIRECDAADVASKAGLTGECLVVPVMNLSGKITSLQYIDGGGNKRFLFGGEKRGCFFPIPAEDKSRNGTLLIGEGLATVLSACMSTGFAGLVAFDCGNLTAVAHIARGRYPEREIVICADNDVETNGNPGLTKAREAALASGSKLAVPAAVEVRHE